MDKLMRQLKGLNFNLMVNKMKTITNQTTTQQLANEVAKIHLRDSKRKSSAKVEETKPNPKKLIIASAVVLAFSITAGILSMPSYNKSVVSVASVFQTTPHQYTEKEASDNVIKVILAEPEQYSVDDMFLNKLWIDYSQNGTILTNLTGMQIQLASMATHEKEDGIFSVEYIQNKDATIVLVNTVILNCHNSLVVKYGGKMYYNEHMVNHVLSTDKQSFTLSGLYDPALRASLSKVCSIYETFKQQYPF
jgi:hypothetical protein